MPLNPPPYILESLKPAPGEALLRIWRCSGYIWSDDNETPGGWSKGHLVASDRRLVFLQDARTLTMKKSCILQQSIQLADVTSVAPKGSKDLVVAWAGRNRPAEATYRSISEVDSSTLAERGPSDVRAVAGEIMSLKANQWAASPPTPPSSTGPMHYVPVPQAAPADSPASFSQLSALLARNGMPMQGIRCTNCGNALFLPSEGNAAYCGHCGVRFTVAELYGILRPSLRNP